MQQCAKVLKPLYGCFQNCSGSISYFIKLNSNHFSLTNLHIVVNPETKVIIGTL